MTYFSSIAWAVALAVTLPYQASHAELFTIEQAAEHALAHNPQLQATAQQTDAARAQRRAAEGARQPRVDLSYYARSSDNPLDAFADKLNTRTVTAADFAPNLLNDPDTSTLHASSLSLRLPVYRGGKLSANITAASNIETTRAEEFARARDLIVFQTKAAYHALQAAERGLKIADWAVAAARRHAKTTARLVREGRIVVSDKLSAQVYLSSMQGVREQARTRVQHARNRLHTLMALPGPAALEVSPWADPSATELAPVTEIESQAMVQRRDVRSAEAAAAAAAARIDVARAAQRPSIDVVARSNWFDDRPDIDNQSWSVAGVLNYNLYAGGVPKHETAAARHEHKRAQLELSALKNRVRNEVRDAYQNVIEAEARGKIARQSVGKARRAVKLIDERYGQGRTILIDLLQAERVLVEARSENLAAALALATGLLELQLAQGDLVSAPAS